MDTTQAATPVYHVITPGDHYSPRTGSAIPTVVHGLATGAAQCGDALAFPQGVVLERGTFEPRYPSARSIEYAGAPAPSRIRRLTDAASGRLGLSRSGALDYFRPAAEVLENEPRGIVLAHNAPAAAKLASRGWHRVFLYAHNNVLRSYSRREAARMLGRTEGIISVSDSLAEELRAHLPAALHSRVHTVLNGVDAAQFTPAEDRPQRPLKVLFVGRMIPTKGADVMLKAAAMLEGAPIEYTIVGSAGFDAEAALSDYESGLRQLAEQVDAPVHFLPFTDRAQLPAVLRDADVFVAPSRWKDPSPLTIGEAMASGLAVVAARSGGIPELLGDAGELFDPDRPEELAAVLRRWAESPETVQERREAARDRAVAHDWAWTWRELRGVLDDTGRA